MKFGKLIFCVLTAWALQFVCARAYAVGYFGEQRAHLLKEFKKDTAFREKTAAQLESEMAALAGKVKALEGKSNFSGISQTEKDQLTKYKLGYSARRKKLSEVSQKSSLYRTVRELLAKDVFRQEDNLAELFQIEKYVPRRTYAEYIESSLMPPADLVEKIKKEENAFVKNYAEFYKVMGAEDTAELSDTLIRKRGAASHKNYFENVHKHITEGAPFESILTGKFVLDNLGGRGKYITPLMAEFLLNNQERTPERIKEIYHSSDRYFELGVNGVKSRDAHHFAAKAEAYMTAALYVSAAEFNGLNGFINTFNKREEKVSVAKEAREKFNFAMLGRSNFTLSSQANSAAAKINNNSYIDQSVRNKMVVMKSAFWQYIPFMGIGAALRLLCGADLNWEVISFIVNDDEAAQAALERNIKNYPFLAWTADPETQEKYLNSMDMGTYFQKYAAAFNGRSVLRNIQEEVYSWERLLYDQSFERMENEARKKALEKVNRAKQEMRNLR